MSAAPRRRLRAAALALVAAVPLAAVAFGAAPAQAVHTQDYAYVGNVPMATWLNGLNVADDGDLLVSGNHSITVFDTSGELPVQTDRIQAVDQSSSPTGAIREASGDYLMASYWLGASVDRYAADGTREGNVVPWQCSRTISGRSMTADSAGNIVLAVQCTGSVEKFTADGSHLVSIPGPDGAAPFGAAVTTDDHIVVAWRDHPGYTEYAPDGTFVKSVDGPLPGGIATDELGNVYLSKASRDGVEKFDAAGAPVASFPVFSGGNSGQSPIAVSADGTTLFSIGPDFASVNVYRAGTEVLQAPALTLAATETSVTASWSAPANLTGGQQVDHYTVTATGPGGVQEQFEVAGDTTTLDITSIGGTPVQPGTAYTVSVTATDAEGTSPASTESITTPGVAPTPTTPAPTGTTTPTATPTATSSTTGTPTTPGATTGPGSNLASTGADASLPALLGGALAVAALGTALALVGLRRRAG